MRRHLLRVLPVVLLTCVPPEPGEPDETGPLSDRAAVLSGAGTLTGEATVYENTPTFNGGAYTEFCIGNVGGTTQTRRGFVRYTLPVIPSGATVTRVQLSFTQENVRSMNGGPRTATLEAHRVTSAWSEGAGGANTRSCGGGTDVAGIDWAGMPTVAATASATRALPVTEPFTVTFDTNVGTADDGLIADVQAWVNGSANHGWRLSVAEEGTADNARSVRPGTLTVSWVLANGGSCDQDDDCASNACVHSDGLDCGGRAGCVCCNAATCASACQTCFRSGQLGTCAPRPAGSVCRNASCTGAVATQQATCTGSSSTCPPAVTQQCAPYFCSGTTCATTCSSSGDCDAGFSCDPMNRCAPIDECAQNLDTCVALAACADPTFMLGDFACTCPMGYQGDGREPPGSGCSDIDECDAGTATCGSNEVCVNQEGQLYRCDCAPGYTRPALSDPCLVRCGDGVVGPTEECDDGIANNSDTAPNACRTNCRRAWCGDGVIDTSEQCDPGGLPPDAGMPQLCTTQCPSDAGTTDAGVADAGTMDAGVVDAGVVDAGVVDAGVVDAGVADAGVADAGVADAGVADAGVADAGVADAGGTDAGGTDAGTDPMAEQRGCGCGAAEGSWGLALLAGVLRRRRNGNRRR